MGNIGSHSGQISNSREGLHADLQDEKIATEFWIPDCSKSSSALQPQVKVLPNLESSRQKLRHTNNGDILHSGGTLSGRHQTSLQKEYSRCSIPNKRHSFDKTELGTLPFKDRPNVSSQSSLNDQFNLCRSEPDLRLSTAVVKEMREKRNKKKYKAPPPPTNEEMQRKQSDDWNKNSCSEYRTRRARLFKTREESKKETNTFEQNNIKKKNYENEKVRPKSLPEFNLAESEEFKKELREATDRRGVYKVNCIGLEGIETEAENEREVVARCFRGEPSGKESSTPEASPVLGSSDIQKPREFFFGMEQSRASSGYPMDEDDENPTIALRLRPVLPRKPTQIPRFSPAAAWKQLDVRSQDSGISGDSRPLFPSSWTPQQDLGDDSSNEDVMREEPRSMTRQQRGHIFSLSLPRDHQPAAFLAWTTSRSGGVSSLKRLKKSVSGALNPFLVRKDQGKSVISKEDESNWFFTRSAPNSLNEHLPEMTETYFPYTYSSARLMYLPETSIRMSPVNDKHNLSAYSKSCEELRVPESLRDTIMDIPWSKDDIRPKKSKKFTFQSTVRQIERRKMADKLSREAEKKEKQRLKELEIMRRVEEEFQKKRAKEKANIRQQLRLYAMDDNQWTSLPLDFQVKIEERQEPDGALSSSDSSVSPSPKFQEDLKKKNFEGSISTHATQELSEYRQIQRDYKEYRGNMKNAAEHTYIRQTTVHPEVTYNMPKARGLNLNKGNYRRDFAYGIKITKSVGSNQSEDSQHSPKIYRNKYSPITRF